MTLKKMALWLTAGILLVLTIVFTVYPTEAQSGPNLFTNPGFEEGHHHQDGIGEITVPDGWRMQWVDGVTFSGAYNDLVANRPETVVWDATGGIPAGEEGLWRDGLYTLKIFKSWAPMYAALSQDVTGLEVGRHYLIVAPVYADIYDWDGRKIAPTDPSHGQVRLGASPVGAAWRNESAIAYSGWFAATYAGYGVFSYEFTATQSDMTVWIEVKATYPHGNNGFFMDTLGLYGLDAVSAVPNPGGGAAPVAPAGPTSTPLPPPTPRPDGAIYHTVQSNDTLWVIAVQYANAMGMTPEEALPRIQELNNNPTFITAGQELLIVPPQENVPAPTATAEATAEAATDTTTDTAVSGSDTGAILASPSGGAGDSGEAAGDSGEAAPTEAAISPVVNSICVSVFSDDNGDKTYNSGTEGILTNAAVTLTRGGNTVATYVSDGVSESHCFDNLEPDTYQIQFFPPAGYQTTTDGSWAVVVSGGVRIPVNFGAQPNTTSSEEVAAVDTAVTPSAAENTDTSTTTVDTATAAADASSPIGTIVIGIAVFLVVLAAVGVVLLRRA